MNMRSYRALIKDKKSSYWRSRVSSERHSPRTVWKSLDFLMGRDRPSPPHAISADGFLKFFISKSSPSPDSSQHPGPPQFSCAPPDCMLSEFKQISVTDVLLLLRRLPNKSSKFDPLPTTLLKSCFDILAPFIVFLLNNCHLYPGRFPMLGKVLSSLQF